MPELHIFTGGKGGVGKTMFALCTLLYYLKKENKKIMFLDVNTTNPSALSIFSHIIKMSGSSIQLPSPRIQEVMISYLKYDDNLYIGYPARLYILPGGVSSLTPSVSGIYGFIASAYEALRTHRNYLFEPDVIIVDTNLSIANFWTDLKDTNQRMREGTKDKGEGFFKPIIDGFTPYYWHLWTLADLMQDFSPFSANLPNALEEIASLWNTSIDPCKFDATKNLINVFNIYALYPYTRMERSLQEKLFFMNTNLEGARIAELSFFEKKKFSKDGISIKQMQSIIRKFTNKSKDVDYSDKCEEMYMVLGEAITEIADSDFNKMIPRNLLSIGTYRAKLVGFTDLHATKADSLKEIEANLKPLFGIINKYLTILLG